jgi:hypothetical protein
MKRILVSMLFSLLAFIAIGQSKEAVVVSTAAEKIVENIEKATSCESVSMCIEREGGSAAECHQKALADGSCKMELKDFVAILEDGRRRTSTSGKVSIDIEELLKELFGKLVVEVDYNKLTGSSIMIRFKQTGELVYERKLSFSGKGLYAGTNTKKFSIASINAYKGKINTAADMKKLLGTVFDQITISLNTKK